MVSPQRIQQVTEEIARRFHPDRIILFGSYAYGTPTEDSDVDLLVVMPSEGRDIKKAIEIRQAIGVNFAMDLLVYDPDYLRQRIEWEDWFLREITQKGKVLYEADHAGVG
ncbi:MAG: nucleotidyltransferase domain-containing protein [Armatimonadetes bacterium]|nr:nucleotidyltransferase domain-containing protein [Armatimonadota bacterium]